jgi:hypothetical protein
LNVANERLKRGRYAEVLKFVVHILLQSKRGSLYITAGVKAAYFKTPKRQQRCLPMLPPTPPLARDFPPAVTAPGTEKITKIEKRKGSSFKIHTDL